MSRITGLTLLCALCNWFKLALLSQLLSRAQQQAGFVYMAEGYFTEAADLMKEGGLDPREVCQSLHHAVKYIGASNA